MISRIGKPRRRQLITLFGQEAFAQGNRNRGECSGKRWNGCHDTSAPDCVVRSRLCSLFGVDGPRGAASLQRQERPRFPTL